MATTVLLAVNGTSDVFCWLDAALKDKPKKVAAAQSENDSTWLAPVAKVPSKHPRVLNLVPSLKGSEDAGRVFTHQFLLTGIIRLLAAVKGDDKTYRTLAIISYVTEFLMFVREQRAGSSSTSVRLPAAFCLLMIYLLVKN